MSWRNQATHREEVTVVKRTLKQAGVSFVSVKHGRGTAWGWLEIRIQPQVEILPEGVIVKDRTQEIISLVQKVTGRRGDYDGRILVDG